MANNNSTETGTETGTEKDTETENVPAQIPLLEGVVFHTHLPLPVRRRTKQKAPTGGEDHTNSPAPVTNDLFGRPPDITLNKTSRSTQDHELETEKIKEHAARVIDSLVQEYSTEIVRRLRDELTSLLDNLDLNQDDRSKS